MDYKLLIALLIPLVGTLGVMLKGDNENVREGISSFSSILLLFVVGSMIPDVLSGKTLTFPIMTGSIFFTLLTG